MLYHLIKTFSNRDICPVKRNRSNYRFPFEVATKFILHFLVKKIPTVKNLTVLTKHFRVYQIKIKTTVKTICFAQSGAHYARSLSIFFNTKDDDSQDTYINFIS